MTVSEYAKNRKNKKTTVGDYARERKKEYDAPEIASHILSRTKNLTEEQNGFIDNYNNRFSGRKGTYEDEYVHDSEDWLEHVSSQNKSYEHEASSIKNLLDQYKSYFSEDFVKGITDALDNGTTINRNIYNASVDDNKYWSQFESADAYSSWAASEKRTDEQRNFDIVKGREDIDSLTAAYDEMSSLWSDISGPVNRYVRRHVRGVDKNYAQQLAIKKLSEEDPEFARKASRYNELVKQYGDIDSFSKSLADKRVYLRESEDLQSLETLQETATKAEDFETYSAAGAALEDNPVEWSRSPEANFYEQGNGTIPDVEGGNPLYKWMKEDEVKIYNYYLGKGDKESADKYAKSLEQILTSRQANKRVESIGDSTFKQILYAGEVGLDQFVSGAVSMLHGDEYYLPSHTQIAGQAVREKLADKGPEILGHSLGQVLYDGLSTTANMLPSILVSSVVGTVNPAAGAITGASLLGASAAGNAKADMLNRGYTKKQANTYGAMVGASEAGLQYLLGGIGKLGGKLSGSALTKVLDSVDNAFARAAIQLGGSMASEGLEESLQTVIEPWLASLVNVDFEAPDIDEVLYSGLLGALSAGILEGGGSVASNTGTYLEGRQFIKNGDVGKLVEIGKTFSTDSTVYSLAERVASNETNSNVGRLYSEIKSNISTQNISDITASLEKQGVKHSDAKKAATIYQQMLSGEGVSASQMNTLSRIGSQYGININEVLSKDSSAVQRMQNFSDISRQYSEAVKMAEENKKNGKKTTTTAPNVETAPGQTSSEASVAETAADNPLTATTAGAEISNVETFYRDYANKNFKITGKYTVSETGKTRSKATGEAVEISEVTSTKDGKMLLQLTDGSEVNAEDVEFSSEDEAIVYEGVAGMDVNAVTAWRLIEAYDPSSGMSGAAYLVAIDEAYKAGFEGISKDSINGEFASRLSKNQLETAYEQGALDRAERSGAINAKREAQNLDKNLSEEQKAARDVSKKLGRKVIFEDTKDFKGFHADGYIDSDGVIHLDVKTVDPINFVLKHELTHFGEGSPLYKDFVAEIRKSKIFEKWIDKKIPGKKSIPQKNRRIPRQHYKTI